MSRRTLGAVMPALLIVLVAVAPSVAASGGPDPVYYTTAPHATGDTCHSSSPCTTPPSNHIQAFHNDEAGTVSVWAENQATGDIDYWQCIEPGLYSGNPSHDPTQGSTAGEWNAVGGTYLGDLDTFGSTYDYQWYDGCWQPCDLPLPPNCIILSAFKEDQPRG